MKKGIVFCLSILLLSALVFLSPVGAQEDQVLLNFYYPVGVAGPLASVVDEMVNEFNETHPNITVQPVYSGDYDDTMQRVQTGVMGGNPPDIAVVEISEAHSLLQMNATIPLTEFIEQEEGDFLEPFFDAFLANGNLYGEQWTIPFQRSTPVFYYNKDHFAEKADELLAAGLDPERAPDTWDELVAYAEVLTDREANRWGLIIPGGWNDWIFEAFAYQNNGQLINREGTEAYFTDEAVLEAAQFWYDLAHKYEVMPKEVRTWAGSPTDFAGEAASMLYNSTGALPPILNTANFEVGVAFMPQNKTYGAAVGGGDFHVFKDIPEANQAAAWEFIKFMTNPENAASWSVESGYVAVREDAYEVPVLAEHVENQPARAVARDQLEYAYPKMSAVGYQQIRQILTDILDEVMEGDMEAETAMNDAQNRIQAILDRH
ncbi:ABC transporter substrate-binding protein [Halanaerobium sp. Z-7514]|uniref:ABC transporter substrate-binding protein n=1 Tax=Halanaerobium polyolivorans TaxID=2886943 RepID=A0AAW4WYJ9_9FIRM|nr:ABC transporter substrate-binding protein [Halanaerobium polyolivorans]MCC3144617.1 ABC transporter substrate-binding protein [Halanaerobium polyolivorans]